MADTEQMTGTLEHVVFHNDKNGYTVADFDVDDEMVTAVGHLDAPQVGTTLELTGFWTEHPVYGEQFQITQYRVAVPTTEAGLIRYLSSGMLPGIGEKTARDIVSTFGDKTLDVLDNDPEQLLKIHGIGQKTYERMMTAYNEQRDERKVLMALQEYGISSKIALKLYEVYGENTVSVVLDNPYKLIRDVRGVGFKVADQLAARLGFDEKNEKRIRAGVLQSLQDCYTQGNTYMTEDELIENSEKFLGVPEDDIRAAISDLAFSGGVHIDEMDGTLVYYPMGLYEAEDSTALAVTELASAAFAGQTVNLDEAIADYERINRITLDDTQKTAIRTAIEQGMAIITGGPGTGKTTIINAVLTILKDMGLTIALAAPTGRAAKRMTETTGENAQTIHRLLVYEYGSDEDAPSFKQNEDNPLDIDALIIDEASMIDIVLMSSLLAAIRPGTRVILVGDADQLPSVGPGNVLHDLIESGIVATVRLGQIYRQSNRSMISTNAKAINEGIVPHIDNHSDFVFIKNAAAEKVERTILDLVGRRLPKHFGKNIIGNIQVISPVKKGRTGVIHLNERLQAILNPPAVDKAERVMGTVVFREGDRVMQIKNDYDLEWEDAYETGKGVYNGDIGHITAIDDDDKTLTVDFTDGRTAVYDFDKLGELQHAFAMTVHKSQGSEFPVVIMPMVGGPPMFLNRKLLYTAVTRAKKLIVLVGRFDQFVRMIRADDARSRKTGLVARIHFYEDMTAGRRA